MDQVWVPEGPEALFWVHWHEQEDFLLQLCIGWLQGSNLDAREVLSSAMLKAWDGAMRSKSDIGNYKAWLAKVLRNHCVDQLRRSNRDRQLKTDPEQIVPLTERQPSGQAPSPEYGMLKEESYQSLLAKMEELPIGLREVLMLRAYQNMSFKEIGQHLHITTENARKRVQTARNLLRAAQEEVQTRQPKTEYEAAETILSRDRQIANGTALFAAPVAFGFKGLEFELPVFHPNRPMRMAQKIETLRRYLTQHPTGWKKELELAGHCWALGNAEVALQHFAAVFERQHQIPEVALGYLQILRDLGDETTLRAAQATLEELEFSESLGNLIEGFAAEANGQYQQAASCWERNNSRLGRILQAKMWTGQGEMKLAAALLQRQVQVQSMDREAFFLLMETQGPDEATLETAQLVLRRFPGDPYAIAQLLVAELAIARPDRMEVKPKWDAFLKTVPNSFLALVTKVAWQALQNEPEPAWQEIESFLQVRPHHLQALAFATTVGNLFQRPGANQYDERRLELLAKAGLGQMHTYGTMTGLWSKKANL